MAQPLSGAQAKGSELFERANAEYDAGNFPKALELFDAAIASGIVNEVVHNNKGASLDALGKNPEAVQSYEKAVALNPHYELAWHNLGNSRFMLEAYPQAAKAYYRAAKLRSGRKENWSGLAASYAKAGKSKKAKWATDSLRAFVEKDPGTLLLMSDLYLDAGFPEDSMRASREYVSRMPDSVEGYARLGSIQHEVAEYAKAIETFERALRIAPNDKELWNNLGYTCFCAGFLDKAIECFDRSIGIDKRYKHAWYNKGYAYHGADMLEDAVKCYRNAIEIDPVDRVLWNNLGNALYNLGKYAESVPKFVEAIKVDPDYEIAWNNIGNALEKMGLNKEAIAFHERSLEISPDFDYALYAKGVCAAMTGDPDTGYDLVLESLDLNPSYDEAWKARSTIAKGLDRWDEALVSIEEALSLNAQFDQGWSERGEILLRVGDPEGAQTSFEMALKCLENIKPNTVGAYATTLRRGDVLVRLGRMEEALGNFESVAVSGKFEGHSLEKTLTLRRFLGRTDLPQALKEAAEASKDVEFRIAYAEFMTDLGRPDEAESILRTIPMPEGKATPELECAKMRARALSDPAGALALMSSGGPGRSGRFARLEGELREAAGEFRKAAVAYRKAVDETPSDALSATGLARMHLRLGDNKAALNAADVTIGIDPHEWEPYRIKSDAYAALGDKERSMQELWRARERLFMSGVTTDDALPGGRS